MYRNFDPVLLDRKEVHVKQQSQGFSPLSSSFATCSMVQSFWHSPFGLLVHLFGAQQLRQGEARPGCQTTDDHGPIVKWKASDLGLLARYICLLAASSRTSYVHPRSLGEHQRPKCRPMSARLHSQY